LDSRVNTFDCHDLLEGCIKVAHGFPFLYLQGILVLYGDIAYFLCKIGQYLSIKCFFESSRILIGFKVHTFPRIEHSRIAIDDRVEPRCDVVLATNGEKFLNDLEIVYYVALKEIIRGLNVLTLQVLDRNNLVKAILGAASYRQQEV
jgi:hypothetical protein